jgi:hypothetical protein
LDKRLNVEEEEHYLLSSGGVFIVGFLGRLGIAGQ